MPEVTSSAMTSLRVVLCTRVISTCFSVSVISIFPWFAYKRAHKLYQSEINISYIEYFIRQRGNNCELLHYTKTRNYRSYRNRNFCKRTKVSKIIAEIKANAHVAQQKKTAGFSLMSVMANLLCLGCFAAG